MEIIESEVVSFCDKLWIRYMEHVNQWIDYVFLLSNNQISQALKDRVQYFLGVF